MGAFQDKNRHGSHPVRHLHTRKQVTGRQHLLPADTEQLTLPNGLINTLTALEAGVALSRHHGISPMLRRSNIAAVRGCF